MIRALHEKGVLGRAYCTETRPFNQVSKLTFILLTLSRKICLRTTVSEKDESTLECIIEFIYLWFCLSSGPWALIIFIRFMFSINLPQGSRLTAFELVHENIPATLIADSAAAALMKTGQVNAVVVGADRVAANGI